MIANMAQEAGVVQTDLTASYLRHELGLDVPIHIQYGRWIGSVFRGSLGVSLWTDTPVIEEITGRIPVSLELGILAIALGLVIAIPIGLYSAIRQDTVGDYIARSFAIFCIAVPTFWLGTMVTVYPSIWWGWSPPVEYIPFGQDPLGNLAQFVVPGVLMGMVLSGTTMRMTRTMMLEVLRQDYIRTAWAKGLKERVVIMRHALKNAVIPVVTIVGLLFPVVVGGTVILEQIFCLPGMGLLMLEALSKRDYPIISGINVVLAGFVLTVNLAVDLTYAYLDPRIQYK